MTTQWDMKMVEAMGLLKMDFLGLRTLTVIDKALAIVNEVPGRAQWSLPRSRWRTKRSTPCSSVARRWAFQLESSGMQEVLRKLKPSSFDDITAVNALYRPGPLGSGMVDDFIDRKHGRKQIEYPHPVLGPILKETYGVILYQEQVMRIAGEMGGFSMAEADTLRKAMGKKNVEVMAKMKERFVEGATANEVKATTAEHVFDLMAYFAGYGFNKSHSASYAVLSAPDRLVEGASSGRVSRGHAHQRNDEHRSGRHVGRRSPGSRDRSPRSRREHLHRRLPRGGRQDPFRSGGHQERGSRRHRGHRRSAREPGTRLPQPVRVL